MIARIRRHLAADQGFTLPELLITTVIMGIIISAIGAALITALRLYAQPAQKLGPSNDANLIANYFTADVQSATANKVDATAPSGCTYVTPVDTVTVVACCRGATTCPSPWWSTMWRISSMRWPAR